MTITLCECEDLRAENERLRNSWISVEERLPDKGSRVLGYDSDRGIVTEAYWNGCWWETWVAGDDCFITHWMPLPEPPREES